MKARVVIDKIRALTGYYNVGATSNASNVLVSNNDILIAINDSAKDLCKGMYRSFLQTISLSPEFTLGNDQYIFSNVDGWSYPVSNNTKPAKEYLNVPLYQQKTRPMFFFDDESQNGWKSYIFNADWFTYYPNEFDKMLGRMYIIRQDLLTPLQSVSFNNERSLNTFKIAFIIRRESDNKIIDKLTVSLNQSGTISRKLNSINIFVNFHNQSVMYVHTNQKANAENYIIEYHSYPYSTSSILFLYNANIRKLYAENAERLEKDVQAFCEPYYVVDEDQEISQILSHSDIMELFIYKCAVDLQYGKREIDETLLGELEEKTAEYKEINRLKKYNEHAFFPQI